MELLIEAVLRRRDVDDELLAVFTKKFEFETLPRVGDTLLMEEVSPQWFEVKEVFHKKRLDGKFAPYAVKIRYSIRSGVPSSQWEIERRKFAEAGWTNNG